MMMSSLLPSSLEHGIHELTEVSLQGISLFGTVILILGAIFGFVNCIYTFYNIAFEGNAQMMGRFTFSRRLSVSGLKGNTATLGRVRLQIGDYTALGLEVLVIADVLETLTKGTTTYTFEELGKLFAVATFRTLLAYFLGKEVDEARYRLDEELEIVNKMDTPIRSSFVGSMFNRVQSEGKAAKELEGKDE